jgi:hypothetical protein
MDAAGFWPFEVKIVRPGHRADSGGAHIKGLGSLGLHLPPCFLVLHRHHVSQACKHLENTLLESCPHQMYTPTSPQFHHATAKICHAHSRWEG